MFEKDAEEYIEEHTFFDEEYGVQSLDVGSKTIFKDGAEFGYNKCKEEIDYLNKHWKSEEERKANKWHDLEKDPTDLPKDKHNVWCKWLDQYGEGWYDKDTDTWTLVYRGCHVHCIYAWCEFPTFDKE